jgi:C4-dicarboxylate-specific signal transduction histidine kinase
MYGTDLILILALVAVGFVLCYLLLLRKLRAIVNERQLKMADQLGALDDAIRALETRLAEHPAKTAGTELLQVAANAESVNPEAEADETADASDETGEIAPEIQAAIAAATLATLGQNAAVRSVKAAPSPWTQQGRVMVQGGHNLRVRP